MPLDNYADTVYVKLTERLSSSITRQSLFVTKLFLGPRLLQCSSLNPACILPLLEVIHQFSL